MHSFTARCPFNMLEMQKLCENFHIHPENQSLSLSLCSTDVSLSTAATNPGTTLEIVVAVGKYTPVCFAFQAGMPALTCPGNQNIFLTGPNSLTPMGVFCLNKEDMPEMRFMHDRLEYCHCATGLLIPRSCSDSFC
ncbi:unnamed protein product [Natator depressus]